MKVELKLKNVEGRYGKDIGHVIEGMLLPDMGKRSDWKGVIAGLNNKRAPIKVNVIQMNKMNGQNGQSYARTSVPIAPVIIMPNQTFRFSYNQPLAYKKSLKQLIQDAPVFAPVQSKAVQVNHFPPMAPKTRAIDNKHPQIVAFSNLHPQHTIVNKQK